MNAVDAVEFERERKFRDLQMMVAKQLHPIASPHDLSESNLRLQMFTNPQFRCAVDSITHLLWNHENPKP